MNKEQFQEEVMVLKDCKESSAKKYTSSLNTLAKTLNLHDFSLLPQKHSEVIKIIDSKENLRTKKSYYTAYLCLLQLLEKYSDYEKEVKALMIESQVKTDLEKMGNNKTKKEEKNWASIEELRNILYGMKNIVNELTPNDYGLIPPKQKDKLQKYTLGMLYVGTDENPPVRLDYRNMLVVNEEEYGLLNEDEKREFNWLIMDNKYKADKFVFGNYKTDKDYGLVEMPIHTDLKELLDILIRNTHKDNNGYLFTNINNKPFTDAYFSKYISSIFSTKEKHISLNLLRKIYISEILDPMLKQRKVLASKMLHSLSVQQIEYFRNL